MKISITQLGGIMRNKEGDTVPIGRSHKGSQVMIAFGTSNAIAEGAEVARITTDTQLTFDGWGAGSSVLLCPGQELWVPVATGQTFTFTAA